MSAFDPKRTSPSANLTTSNLPVRPATMCVMRAVHVTGLALVAAVVVLTRGPAPSQMQRMGDTAVHTLHQPYSVETFGVFRKIIVSGDFSPNVRLADVMAKHPMTGVGALADALGEITIYDGKLVVSYGYAPSADTSTAFAALLAMASVDEWQSVPVASDVSPEEIESFIFVAAKTHGIDPTVSFPFEVRGNIGPYLMHVNADHPCFELRLPSASPCRVRRW
jgi:hypothetical protein